jgi:long-chain acyl-CoA synthetase
MSANLAANLVNTAAEHGDRPAVKQGDAVLTYRQLDGATTHIAGMLKVKGVEPGDRVGIMLPNVAYVPVIYYGILRAGAVIVPMNPLLKGREVAFHLRDSGARLLFAWADMAEAAQAGAEEEGAECILVAPGEFEQQVGAAEPDTDVVERAEDDTAVILYTSGTTGQPKGAELTHGNMGRNAQVSLDLFGYGPDGVLLGALPLFHSFGQTCCMNAAIRGGACLVLLARFDPGEALRIIQDDQVTVFAGVPTMYTAMLHHPERDAYDTSRLEVCASGGSAMPGEVLRGFEDAFETKVLEGYGLSETSPVASFNHPDRERKIGSIGTPIEGVEMKVVDDEGEDVAQGEVGEIAIRGHNVMKGYWNKPDATRDVLSADGWFRTGDMARVDEEGYFFIVDRKKDLIIRGGYNVYPREIEEVLYEHPAVREVAVVAVPHESLGEEVGAAVALKEDAAATPEELRDFVKERVAAYKYPRQIWIVDDLPKGPTGKILKREVDVPAREGSAS